VAESGFPQARPLNLISSEDWASIPDTEGLYSELLEAMEYADQFLQMCKQWMTVLTQFQGDPMCSPWLVMNFFSSEQDSKAQAWK
jgi:hypothetical protein